MIYTMNSRIRYSETDTEGVLTLPSLIDYFQDTATFHGEDRDVSMEKLKRCGLTWVLGSWQVNLYRLPKLGEEVQVQTWACRFGLCLGTRRFSMAAPEGGLLAEAEALYMLINTDKGTPADVPDWMSEGYGIEAKTLSKKTGGRKIKRPEEGETFPPVTVSLQMLDTNHHVNNGQFISLAAGYLPEDLTVSSFRAEYKQQAFLGDELYPVLSKIDGGYIVSLNNAGGEEYFTGEWKNA